MKGVSYPLTAAVARLYGIRSDGAYAIGAFYTVNIDAGMWRHAGGVWYQPIKPDAIDSRSIREEDMQRFVAGITTGEETLLRRHLRYVGSNT
jgi:hypothetical protein